jgi:hypothetical protein
MADAARLVLMYAMLPLWIAAGLADWACHRRAAIEHTAGLRENLFHWLLFAEVGVGMVAVALFEVNGAVLLIVLGALLLHEATVYVELRYAVSMRRVEPFEQMVHSFLEVLPLGALALLVVIHLGQSPANARFDLVLEWKREPWPPGYLVGAMAAVTVFNVLPLAEEAWRCISSRIPPRLAPK